MNRLHTVTAAVVLQSAAWAGAPGLALADASGPETAPRANALTDALQAHGGLDTWRSFARMDYTTEDFPLGAHAPFNFTQTTDLRNRRHLTRGAGFVAGKDDSGAWALPNTEALGLPPAFFEEGNFYFIAMPFVFADPGVVTRDIAPVVFQGKAYDRVAVTYPDHLGDTPEDDYILYIDQDSRRLKMIDFVPTSAEVNGETPLSEIPRKALVFDSWQRYEGLLIPSRATFFGWSDGQLQGEGNSYTVRDVTFSTSAPKPDIFSAQHSGVIEGTAHAE